MTTATIMLSSSGTITLPPEIRDALDWEMNTYLELQATGNGIVIRPVAAPTSRPPEFAHSRAPNPENQHAPVDYHTDWE